MEYVNGFGDLNNSYFNYFFFLLLNFFSDFWLGLDKMHELTLNSKTLVIELWYNNAEYASA